MRNLLLALTLTLLAPASLLAAEGDWRVLGPDGGPVSDLTFQPGSSQILYAAVQGGIYKSRDAGATWVWAGKGLYAPAQTLSVVVDPVHPETVYTTQGDRVYKSVDGGLSWKSSGLVGTYQVAVHPRSSGTVFAATIQGIFRTADGGVTWSRVGQGLPQSYSATLIAFDPFVERRLYAWIQAEFDAPVGTLVRSNDGGATWQTLPHGPQENQRIYSLAIDPRVRGTLYAGTNKAVYKSVDGGLSWKPTGLDTAGFVGVLKVHPRLGTLYAGTSSGLFRSADGGASWRRLFRGLEGNAVFALAFSPASAQTVYAGVDTVLERAGVFKSGDGGVTWTFSGRGISALYIQSIAVNPQNPDTLWAIGSAVPFKSTDRGKTWTRVRFGGDGRATRVAIDPQDGSTVYLVLPDGTLRRSHDGGQTWESAGTPGTATFGNGIVVIDPQNPSTLYVAGLGFARSADGGTTWTRAAGDPADLVFSSLALAPAVPSTLYGSGGGGAAGDRTLRSLDGGATWTRAQQGLPSYLLDLTVDPLTSTTVYAHVFDGTIYRTADGGGTWSVFSQTFRDKGVSPLVISPFDPGLLLAGVWFENLYETRDGATWEPLGSNPDVVFATLAFDPKDPCRLYAGTGGRGLLAFTRRGTTECP
ncbi:MAG TPA: hypothetical protein VGH73_14110 [Thermoanaerobaculia bacterium]|jgi:photosystem II stability/assembly factor-like uncharacterized protein